MLKRITHFVKYNNAMVLILALVFVVGSGVFAQTEAGREFIGEKHTRLEGRDNTVLLEARLEAFDQEFRIETIENDDKYFYIKYTCVDLIEKDMAWQYQVNEKIRKVSKKFKGDLGKYMAEELKEEHEARIKELKVEQEKAQETGERVREEVTEYSGLIGQTLNTVSKVFSNYEPIKRKTIALPEQTLALASKDSMENRADELTNVYEEYMDRMDPDDDDVLGVLDNCPDVYNPDQVDKDDDGLGDACDDYYTLKPVFDDPLAGSGQGVTSTDEIINNNATSTEDIASSSETTSGEDATNNEEVGGKEFEVKIVELGGGEESVASST